jgi:hypothetical protein
MPLAKRFFERLCLSSLMWLVCWWNPTIGIIGWLRFWSCARPKEVTCYWRLGAGDRCSAEWLGQYGGHVIGVSPLVATSQVHPRGSCVIQRISQHNICESCLCPVEAWHGWGVVSCGCHLGRRTHVKTSVSRWEEQAQVCSGTRTSEGEPLQWGHVYMRLCDHQPACIALGLAGVVHVAAWLGVQIICWVESTSRWFATSHGEHKGQGVEIRGYC